MRRAYAFALLAFLLVPLALSAILSGMEGLAARLPVAAASAVLASLLGTGAAIGLRSAFAGRRLALAAIALPLLLPPVLPAAALLLASGMTGLADPRPWLVLWHTLLGAPLVALVVGTALDAADPAPLRAAEACGVPPELAERRLVSPLLRPAAAAGAGLAFAVSAGEAGLSSLLGAGASPDSGLLLASLGLGGMVLARRLS